MVRSCNVADFRGSSPGLDARRGLAALLLLAVLALATAVAQWTPQPVFTELFAYALRGTDIGFRRASAPGGRPGPWLGPNWRR
jgi:hypothetical protein